MSFETESAIEFQASPEITFDVQTVINTSPRATAQLPYLLTMTPRHQEREPLYPKQIGLAPAVNMYSNFSVPLPATTLATAQAQLLSLVQQQVAEAAKRVAEASQQERLKKQKKSASSCLWCNSSCMTLFGHNEENSTRKKQARLFE